MPYRVERGTSTRASLDPASPDFETWVDWQPGDVVAEWPEHTPVAELVESGAWAGTDDDPAPKRRKGKGA